jgi:hypothetical protein
MRRDRADAARRYAQIRTNARASVLCRLSRYSGERERGERERVFCRRRKKCALTPALSLSTGRGRESL